jgi:hypothetical protein
MYAAPGQDLQALVDTLEASGGGTLHLTRGTYQLPSPLLLPRTTANGRDAVRVVGEGVGKAILAGDAGCIAWKGRSGALPSDPGAKWRAFNQHIEGLTLRPGPVDGARAIHFACEDKEDPTAEKWTGTLHNLSIEGSNRYHAECIYLEGTVHSSRFVNIWNDPARATPAGLSAYATRTIRFDEGDGSNVQKWADHLGAHWSYFENLVASPIRGGWSTMFRGRLAGCVWNSSLTGVGSHDGSIQYDVRYSIESEFVGVSLEGQAERPQIRLTSCDSVDFRRVLLGTPNHSDEPFQGSELGNGIELVDCTGCSIVGARQSTSSPSWSHANYPTEPAESVYKVHLDATTRLCSVDVDIGNIDTSTGVVFEAGTPAGRYNRIRTYRRYDNQVVERYNGVTL